MNASSRHPPDARWPELPYEPWKRTAATLQLWTQIVGKIRATLTPWTNHSWHVTLYVSDRGLTTGPIVHGERTFSIEFDLIGRRLVVSTCDGERALVPLEPQTTADFYRRTMRALHDLQLTVAIHRYPNEVPEPRRFDLDREHASYDAEAAERFWRVLLQVDRVFRVFRAGFIGKVSPVHFFWGSFDLAVTRFSGREAPEHPGGIPNLPDWVTREAYSHEVSSAGFWPGADALPQPIFYSYAYPAPDGFAGARVLPDAASWNAELGEFVLAYDAVRRSSSPDRTLLDFLRTTYEAAADLGRWDRAALERTFDLPRRRA
ncbi:MAG TPA: DUF5996 family protein [Candidatus Polarisedimenticolaceae bacterium]|nr:DUF5996 family protein [Candidatus Polarisedimenticolaceae bacterium]